jgi:hypothetical protein
MTILSSMEAGDDRCYVRACYVQRAQCGVLSPFRPLVVQCYFQGAVNAKMMWMGSWLVPDFGLAGLRVWDPVGSFFLIFSGTCSC